MTDKRVLLVTGGGRGIGAAVSRKAAQAGWHVVINFAQNAGAADTVVRDIEAQGGSASAIQGDTGLESGIFSIFNHIDQKYGRLDGLVNNAGVVDVAERVVDYSRERLERMLVINVIGKIRAASEAIKRMSTARGGRGGSIVNISSMAAVLGAPGQYVDYAASKGAIDTFTLGLAREVATEGIRVNAIRPGIIDTDIHAAGGIPDRAKSMAPNIPMQRAGMAQEVADAVLYLLSKEASYVTGAILNVSGGR